MAWTYRFFIAHHNMSQEEKILTPLPLYPIGCRLLLPVFHQHDEAIDPNSEHNGVLINTILRNLDEGWKRNGPEQEYDVDDLIDSGKCGGEQNKSKSCRRAGKRPGDDDPREMMSEYNAENGIA